MDVLVNAGGKGSRISSIGVEKPLLEVKGRTCIDRVLDSLLQAQGVEEILVSVSPNTPETRRKVIERGVRVIDTSGEDFVLDLHSSLSALSGEKVMICPSDLPLLKASTVESFLHDYHSEGGESYLAMVPEGLVTEMGISPSYVWDLPEGRYVVSGVSIVDRLLILADKYLEERFYFRGGVDLAINVNTPEELEMVRRLA